MKELTVSLPERSYPIMIERGLLARSGELCRQALPRAKKLAVVTDSNVAPLYAEQVLTALAGAGFEPKLFPVPAGEKSKNPAQLSQLWEGFLSFGLTRTDAVAALGGGVVGDLAGFAAATALRGVDFVQLPTTLLAQVDSSVGGKVAVDLKAGKNLAGAFWQPKLVLIDPDVLATLPDRFFTDGMGEVIKYGCIWDEHFLAFLEQNPSRAALEPYLEGVIAACCDVKRQVVEQDEHDTGLRMILNFGHTLGHAYELAGGYETYTHGEAVAAGMVAAARIGEYLDFTPAGSAQRLAALVSAFGLPEAIACSMEHYVAAVGLDKKGAGDDLSLILLRSFGRAEALKLPKSEVYHLLEAAL